jgi:3-hydroxyisobutyrate dehydrogenase
VGPSILGGQPAPDFTLRLAHKDVRLACQMGAESGVPMPFGDVALEFLETCIAEVGADAKVDQAALVVDKLAGTHIVASARIFD